MSTSCPAHATKHIPVLHYSFANNIFHLKQLQDGVSNGTALWLGGQCLAAYLAMSHAKFSSTSSQRPPRAIELGSGIGLTALSLSSLGWDVMATDIPHVINSVLKNNVRNNHNVLPPGSGRIVLRELDWLVLPDHWLWDHPDIIASPSPTLLSSIEFADHSTILGPPYDLICTADTIYDPTLVTPLLRTLHNISTFSTTTLTEPRPPSVLLCLERRDPALVDRFLQEAVSNWHFSVARIPHRKLMKAVQKHNPHWTKEDWEGVELWKLKLITSPRSVDEA